MTTIYEIEIKIESLRAERDAVDNKIKDCRKEINRIRARAYQKEVREKNRAEYNAKMVPINKKYYLENKDRLNLERMQKNQKKRDEQKAFELFIEEQKALRTMEEYESLGIVEKN